MVPYRIVPCRVVLRLLISRIAGTFVLSLKKMYLFEGGGEIAGSAFEVKPRKGKNVEGKRKRGEW